MEHQVLRRVAVEVLVVFGRELAYLLRLVQVTPLLLVLVALLVLETMFTMAHLVLILFLALLLLLVVVMALVVTQLLCLLPIPQEALEVPAAAEDLLELAAQAIRQALHHHKEIMEGLVAIFQTVALEVAAVQAR